MATMLSVLACDLVLTADQAQAILSRVAGKTYNAITIDGDMSTNDTVLLLANEASGFTPTATDLEAFEAALVSVCTQLAQGVVRDGEGATKFVTISVQGLETDDQARQIAHSIANSPLVKTAFYGGDANWGRVIMAAGKAGIPIDPDSFQLSIAIGQHNFSAPHAFSLVQDGLAQHYAESDANAIVQAAEFSVMLTCFTPNGAGQGKAFVWTCDFSHDYVSINGHYRS
jgi:glutamate N-acetyltransferase / amino-acid N-acetyltransferase